MSKILVGKTITRIMVAKDKGAVLFKTTEGDIVANADGDCCSHSWIESVELPVNGFPAVVSDANDIPLNEDKDTRDGELAFYGFKITTDKGDIIIDYRNESNGYYGGNLSWPDDGHFYGGVYEQNVSAHEWEAVAA